MNRFLKHDEPALIWTGELVLDGRLTIPSAASGLILMPGVGGTFQHEGVRALAAHFHDNGFATLIADLLTPDEQQFDARTRHFRTDLPLLADRIVAVAEWLAKEGATCLLPVAFFGSGVVGSAALFAASAHTARFFAFTITCPRLGLLYGVAPHVKAPALLLIDETVSQVTTAGVLDGETRVESIASVTPLLESHAAMEEVTQKAIVWFRNHVPAMLTIA